MKIAFIINSLSGGGAERVIQTLSNYLVKENEIFLILLEDTQQKYNLDENIKVIILKSSSISKSIGKIIFIPLQSVELYFLLKKLKIESAISFLVRSNLVFSFMKFFSKRKIIISERNYSKIQYETQNFKNKIMNFLIKVLYKQADIIIPISNGIKESLVRDYNLDKNKIKTIYNPQNIDFIKKHQASNTNFKFKSDIKYFITLGRLILQKDHKLMIEAFQKVNIKNPNTNLIILGEGPMQNTLTSLIKELNLEQKVHLLGFQEDPFSYLKQADIFVFSSKFEGFGNVLVEAMACGLPIVSTNCPSGPAEILENGKYGSLTKVGDIDELAEAMIFMLNEQNIKLFKEKSLQRADDFDVKIIAKEYLNILEGKK